MQQNQKDRLEIETNQALFHIYKLQAETPLLDSEGRAYLEVIEELMIEFQMHVGIKSNAENNSDGGS